MSAFKMSSLYVGKTVFEKTYQIWLLCIFTDGSLKK